MSTIHIHREHHLGHAAARKLALRWAEEAERDFGMACTYEEGDDEDTVHFQRTGASGTLKVLPHAFELEAKLGFLLGAFKDRIEAEIVKNLDELLAHPPAARKAAAGPHADTAAKKMGAGKKAV
ncbi:putative polyhydroxyalkanoate system protein [Tibeticola sediminis]|uniref:Putative polyhydroxyalkanoate system protein n=1 Tax=Tibeticola sediminis TaxID=1917811 RepID=A0A3N4VGR1_9BURK|nr:polyhydroxyalkanoic acid system family protein [Tibeticola sediminis]RPE73090.1 putative polyhydroxyalkanoate system protein [Tibeticola sediminis]